MTATIVDHGCVTQASSLDRLDRRRFLRGLAGGALLGLAGPALSGCQFGGVAEGAGADGGRGGARLPKYLPYTGPRPDLPGTEDGVNPAFFRFPTNPVRAVAEGPGHGRRVRIATTVAGPVPPGPGRNEYWSALNARVGADLDFQMVPAAEWQRRFASLVDGDDLPDLVRIHPGAPNRSTLLKERFADLTELLAGDAVADFPFLANLPTYSWRGALDDGRVYGVPVPRPLADTTMYIRTELVPHQGRLTPSSFAEFHELCRSVTDPKAGRWALACPDQLVEWVYGMAGPATVWVEENGRFTHQYERDEYRRALSAVIELVRTGCLHPDSFTADLVKRRTLLDTGRVVMNHDSYTVWADTHGDPDADPNGTTQVATLRGLVPPGFEGGEGAHRGGTGNSGFTAFRKADTKTLRRLLGVVDWLAAPLGTQEYLLRKFGRSGVDHTLVDGYPVLTETGRRETGLPTNYVTDAPPILGPAPQVDVAPAHAWQAAIIPITRHDPRVGLFAPTEAVKGAPLAARMTALQRELLRGRRTLAEWDEAVRRWRKDGGDTIRSEYERSFEQNS